MIRKSIIGAVLALALLVPASALAATPGQTNAKRSAAQYLQFQAFSRSGLIDQLKFEGYTKAQATYGVTALHANWSAQAAKAAKQYLKMQGFSRKGLIDQLRFEGYTLGQATYGVKKAGL